MITRVIIPIASRNDRFGNSGHQFGLGDTTPSFQLVSVGGGARVWLETPGNGPDWGVRFELTLLYPK